MRRIISLISLSLLCLSLSACLTNSVREFTAQQVHIPNNESVIVLALKNVPATLDAKTPFAVTLNEYDLTQKKITGNCWHNNQVSAVVDAGSDQTRFFAFRVPPGFYIFSGFNVRRLNASANTFEAPAGKLVYLGTFQVDGKSHVSLTEELASTREFVKTQWPQLESELNLATRLQAPAGPMFLCSP
ncbi:hypothetical protein RF679_00640 [Undibacterium cyanobacteriorum]|uniref:Lipoprotein n=1 Tax=Undibacterium cyanobacteriorum TaxID=3073561 RepID=A0ABY9RKA8_9BURK|nr:hypothetical protein [Undibacterium sp. 20NA77.5]WMW80802.1 hypothetical protein RF679_00640 [Undibacterium sp. 20NA77.5]